MTLKDYFFKITKAPNWQSYSVDLDSTGKQVKIENATPEDLDANRLVGKIYLKPTKALEFIDIEFFITPTGASFENI